MKHLFSEVLFILFLFDIVSTFHKVSPKITSCYVSYRHVRLAELL